MSVDHPPDLAVDDLQYVTVAARIEREDVEQLDALARRLAAETNGVIVRRSDALRAVIKRGLATLDAQQKAAGERKEAA